MRFHNRGGLVRVRNMQEFSSCPDLLRHRSSVIEHPPRKCLAACVKAINFFPRGNPSRDVSRPIVDRQRFRYGNDYHFGIQGLC